MTASRSRALPRATHLRARHRSEATGRSASAFARGYAEGRRDGYFAVARLVEDVLDEQVAAQADACTVAGGVAS